MRDAATAFGLAASARIAPAGVQGTFHRLFDVNESGRSRLLRVAALPGEAAAHLMALECKVMEALRAMALPVPACEFRAVGPAGAARGVHLVERAPGVSLARADDHEPRMLQALAWVASLLARLHQVRGSGYGLLSLAGLETGKGFVGVHAGWDDYVLLQLDAHLQACREAGDISEQEAAEIAALFADARTALRAQPAALLHGDPGNHNFLVDDSRIRAVIDWEDALLGDPLFDLASLCTFHPERRHAAIWSAYGVQLTPGEPAWGRFWLYFLRIALAKTVHRHRFAYVDRPDRAPAARRIQLALAKLREGSPAR